MEKKITFKKGMTITGLFDKLKEPGDIITVSKFTVESGYRAEARRRNEMARILREVDKKDVKFSVSVNRKDGTISLTYNKSK